MVELRLPGDKALVLSDEPRLDEAALLAFLGGHCHSLALALHERTKWPLVAIRRQRDGACIHVAARRPDGRIVDIAGAHLPERIYTAQEGDVTICECSASDLADLHDQHGWAEPVPELVSPWVEIALRQAEREPRRPLATGKFVYTRTTLSDIEVRVVWDGEPQFCVEVRAAGRLEPWKLYSRVAFPRDDDGLYRYSFTLEWFKPVADAWLKRQFEGARATRILGM